MKRLLLSLILLASLVASAFGKTPSPASSEPSFKTGDRIAELRTTDGRAWKDVTIVRIEPDSITISTKDILARVLYETMDAGLQTRFGYDPSKAAQYAQKRKEAEQKGWAARQSNANDGVPSASADTRVTEALAAGAKNGESRRLADEKNKATLQEFHSKRMAEENEAAVRRQEANDRMKARIAEREKTKKKAAGKK